MLTFNNHFPQSYSSKINLSESTNRMSCAITKSREDIASDLNSITAKVREICQITGIVGLSAAVIHQGEAIWKENIGYKNLDEKLPITSDTAFLVGALSQGFTAACIAQLKHKGILSYEDKITDHLEKAEHPDRIISDNITIGDLLGHRTGLQAADYLAMTHGGRLNFQKQDDVINIYRSLKRQASPRSQFLHGSINYALLDSIVSSHFYNEHVKGNVWLPLSMLNTIGWPYLDPLDKERPLQYQVLRNGKVHRPSRAEGEDLVRGAHSTALFRGARSTVHDLIKYCNGLNMAAGKCPDSALGIAQRKVGIDRCRFAFPDVDSLFEPLQTIKEASPNGTAKKSYAAGWATCTLPDSLGDLGINPTLVHMPTVAGGSDKVTVYWNQGMFCGPSSFIALLPTYNSAVIVLSNTRTANDAADLIGQLLLQTLLGSPLRNNYTFLAQVTVDSAHQKHDELLEKIEKGRQSEGPRRPLDQYDGEYFNPVTETRIIVTKTPSTSGEREGLLARFRYVSTKEFAMQHHHGDSFTWSPDWDDLVLGGLPIIHHPEHYFLHFNPSEDGKRIASVTWVHDPEMPDGDIFFFTDHHKAKCSSLQSSK